MATTVHQPPTIEPIMPPSRPSGGSGRGGFNFGPNGAPAKSVQEYAPPPASTAIWVLLASITMTFAALTSALVVRKGGAVDWRHLAIPPILYLNTLILLASSVTLQIARRRVASFMSGSQPSAGNAATWLYVTLSLGFLFVGGQYVAWRQLNADGLYLATNPSSSFFYVFTAAHALHLTGGLCGLMRVIRKFNHRTLRRSTLNATVHYWHFMDGLWIYLLALLWMKL